MKNKQKKAMGAEGVFLGIAEQNLKNKKAVPGRIEFWPRPWPLPKENPIHETLKKTTPPPVPQTKQNKRAEDICWRCEKPWNGKGEYCSYCGKTYKSGDRFVGIDYGYSNAPPVPQTSSTPSLKNHKERGGTAYTSFGSEFKFLGKPDSRFPNLKTGETYRLVVGEVHWSFWEWVIGKRHPQIIMPFNCPYQSWETFNKNWKKV